MKPRFTAVDCETTGFHPECDEIIEIGIVTGTLGGPYDTYEKVIRPKKPIPKIVQQLTGITDSECEKAPAISEVIHKVQEKIEGSTIIGHNIEFDIRFLTAAGVDFSGCTHYDTFNMAGFLLPKMPSQSLVALCEALGVTLPRAHRAADDAMASLMLFERLLAHAASIDSSIWQQLEGISERARGIVPLLPLVAPKAFVEEESKEPQAAIPADKLVHRHTLVEACGNATDLCKEIANTTPVLQVVAKGAEAYSIHMHTEAQLCIAKAKEPSELLKTAEKNPAVMPLVEKILLHPKIPLVRLTSGMHERQALTWITNPAEAPEENYAVTTYDELMDAPHIAHERVVVLEKCTMVDFHWRMHAGCSLGIHNVLALLGKKYEAETVLLWGLAGQLQAKATNAFGTADVSCVTGYKADAAFFTAGKKWLAKVGACLPHSLTKKLELFFNRSAPAYRLICMSMDGSITLKLQPKEGHTLSSAWEGAAKVVGVDTAIDGADDAAKVKADLQLPADTCVIAQNPTVNVWVPTELPKEKSDRLSSFQDEYIEKIIQAKKGKVAVMVHSTMAVKQLLPQISRRHPKVLASRLSGTEMQIEEKAHAAKDVVYIGSGTWVPSGFSVLVIPKLSFFVRPGAQFMQDTLPEAVRMFRAMAVQLKGSSEKPAHIICLDPRLTEKKYGLSFLAGAGVTAAQPLTSFGELE